MRLSGDRFRRARAKGRPAAALKAGAVAVLVLVVAAASASATSDSTEARSTGCGRAPPMRPPTTVTVDDRQRPLIAVVPQAYHASTPHDLVIGFHGRTNSNARVRGYYDLERHAERPTIFVYPTGLPVEGPQRSWADPGDPAADLRDYRLFDAIVGRLGAAYCLELDRVFAVGHSLGAWFVNSLGCARGDVLRGIATVAGGVSPSACSGPVAALLVHNPDDRLVPVARGEAARELFLAGNGLAGPPVPTMPASLDCVRYGGGDTPNPVIWCAHDHDRTWRGRYYPHQWPQGTGAAVMSFFSSLPAAPP